MANERKHECDSDCEHSPKFQPHPKLEECKTTEPKHTEAAPLVPIVPMGS